jgi:hypothetical protein
MGVQHIYVCVQLITGYYMLLIGVYSPESGGPDPILYFFFFCSGQTQDMRILYM